MEKQISFADFKKLVNHSAIVTLNGLIINCPTESRGGAFITLKEDDGNEIIFEESSTYTLKAGQERVYVKTGRGNIIGFYKLAPIDISKLDIV